MSDKRFQIRAAVVDDAEALAALATSTFVATYGAYNRPEDTDKHVSNSFGVAQQTAEIQSIEMSTIVVVQDTKLVAYAQLTPKEPPACFCHSAPIHLYRFYSIRETHGSGLAQQLMREVKRAAQKRQYEHLWLTVWEENPRAISFYKKSGFADVGEIEFVLGNDRQRDRMLVAPVSDA